MPPKFGRRAENNDETKSSTQHLDKSSKHSSTAATPNQRPTDRVLQPEKLLVLDDGVDPLTSEQAAQQAVERKERIVRSVADAPLSYSVPMPKLAELDITNQWSEFLQSLSREFDMPALTSCLVQNLDDEDVPWNPDMLLVQLTSDMLGAPAPLDAAPAAGKGSSAESRRRRRAMLEEEPEAFAPAAPQRGRRGDTAAGGQKGDSKPRPAKPTEGWKETREKSAKGGRPQGGAKQSGDGKQEKPSSPAKKTASSKTGGSTERTGTAKANPSKEGPVASSSSKPKNDANAPSAKGTTAPKTKPEAK